MALGKGLGAILEDIETSYLKDFSNNDLVEIDVEKIKPNPFQPRKEFKEESIKELADSIKQYGLMQPIVVIKDGENFILVSGERRLRAYKYLKKDKIKAIVLSSSLKELREYALIENIQRENLSAVEIALSLKHLLEEHNYTHDELAEIISKSRSYVTNLLRILKLPDFVLEKIDSGELSVGHAKVLLTLSEDDLNSVVEKILNENLNVRETERIVKKIKKKSNPKVDSLVKKFKKAGFKVEATEKYVKIKFKNEKDLKKLEKLLSFIS